MTHNLWNTEPQPELDGEPLHDRVSLRGYFDDGLTVKSRLLEVDYHQTQAAASGGCLGYKVGLEATEAGPDHNTEVSLVQESQAPLPDVLPRLTPGLQSRVGGVKPGAMDLVNSLLRAPGLLKEAILIQTDNSVNEALLTHCIVMRLPSQASFQPNLVETREGEVGQARHSLSPLL